MGKQLKKKEAEISRGLVEEGINDFKGISASGYYQEYKENAFIVQVEKKYEDFFVENYDNLKQKVTGLVEVFMIDFENFKTIIFDNRLKEYCKIYFIEDINGHLNLGISLTDYESLSIDPSKDELYVLENKSFTPYNFSSERDDFQKGLGGQIVNIHKLINTEMIFYQLNDIEKYIEFIDLNFNCDFLKWTMILYRDKDQNGNRLRKFEDRNKRISFCIHAIVSNGNGPSIESIGSDMGNLRP